MKRGTTILQKLTIVSLLTLFILTVVGGVQFGNPVVANEHTPNKIVCDIHSPVTDASCAAGWGSVFTLLALLAFGWLLRTTYPRRSDVHTLLWKLYALTAPYSERPIVLPLLEAFRRGIIHPNIYHRAFFA